MATLLNRQKPMDRDGSAWCPGGRTAQKALAASPATTASTAAQTAPAARSAASPEPGERTVSMSSAACPLRGTAANTAMVSDINLDEASSFPLPINEGWDTFTMFQDRVFFFADDGEHGFELWKTDGTSPGTAMVKDINPGPSSSQDE